MQKTSAWPLAWVYVGLIVYASLYPFDGWRIQGIAPWSFMWAPWPQYWTSFDVLSNVLGYAPLGFFFTLALRRTRPQRPALTLATLMAAALSWGMESLQFFLPMRVPSNVDWLLNVLGAWSGGSLAALLTWAGVLARWSRFRSQWFIPDARGALVLLALWPVGLLFPAPVAFGLGQVYERLEETVTGWLQDTPWLEYLPMREVELQPMLQGTEVLCVWLGLLLPCLLAFSVVRNLKQRWTAMVVLWLAGLLASALSAALTYGPVHAWDWTSSQVRAGLVASLFSAAALALLSRRTCLVLALVFLVLQLALLNNAATDAYFSLTLQTWEQGRFIRFHGVIQWIGWLWPYVALAYLMQRLSNSSPHEGG
jgi:VanZ family protein